MHFNRTTSTSVAKCLMHFELKVTLEFTKNKIVNQLPLHKYSCESDLVLELCNKDITFSTHYRNPEGNLTFQ